MNKQERMRYLRQSEIVNGQKLAKGGVTVVGIGSVGSFTALTLAKMGVGKITTYDQDGVEEHNLPAQFYKNNNIGQFKSDCLEGIIKDFSDIKKIKCHNKYYKKQKLGETVIVATDSLASRKMVWEQFLKQPQCKYFIDARMGAELGKVFIIKDKEEDSVKFYEETLQAKAIPLPCTARTIIYNVLMLASLISRSYKSIIQEETIPREIIFNMTRIDDLSWMTRD